MSDATTQEIKSKLDIAEFLRGYITLIPAGKNFKAVCPFHKEKTPSFMVSPDRQTWHCFGSCNTGGDIFTFLMRYENIEFFEALKVLAEKAGIELKRADPAEQRQFGVLYDINNIAKNFFMDELRASKIALAYIEKRGLKPETLHEFEIGFAPNKPDALTLHLIHKGVNVQDIERSGLAFKADRGGYMDRFRGRIMFPIANHFGKVVGFTGRVLPEFDTGTMGKYVNSPETAIFKKSKLLYGFFKTKHAIREMSSVLLVEGQMDFLMSYQDGIRNAVATSGTALTSDHLTVLRKYAETAVLCFDRDEAGLEAAERAIDLTHQFDFDTKVLLLPEPMKDPADVVEKTPGMLAELIKSALPAMQFYLERYLANGQGKKQIREVLQKIKKLSSALDRNVWIRALGERVGFSEKDLIEEMEQIKAEVVPAPRETAQPTQSEPVQLPHVNTRRGMITENLLGLAISKNNILGLEPHRQYFPPLYQRVYDELSRVSGQADQAVLALADTLSLRAGMSLAHSEGTLVSELKREFMKERQEELQKMIQRAERAGDEATLANLVKEVDLLSHELHNEA
jgi:DNA primase